MRNRDFLFFFNRERKVVEQSVVRAQLTFKKSGFSCGVKTRKNSRRENETNEIITRIKNKDILYIYYIYLLYDKKEKLTR